VGEESARDIDTLTNDLITHIKPHLAAAQPYAIYGHSMGGWIAYWFVRALSSSGARLPIACYLSAIDAPHAPPRYGPVHTLDDQKFIQHLRELGGTPEEVLTNTDLMVSAFVRDYFLSIIALTVAWGWGDK
jgi:medium-chain acyl-[acyl-carrier-protein] hydrolase